MLSDFDQIAEMGPPGSDGPPDVAGLQKGLDDFRRLGANLKVANEAAQTPPQPTKVVTKTSPDGKKTVAIEGDASLAEYYGKAGSFYQQAMGGMQQELQRMDMELKQREMAARNQPPWVQLATALSANLASQKDMPGWVRGLGQTAAQLNPRPEQIQAQRREVLGQEAQLAEAGARIEETGLQHRLAAGQKFTEEENKKVKSFMQDARLTTKTGEPMTRAMFEAKADLWDIPQAQRQALYEGHVAQAGGVVKQEERKVEQKQTFAKFREQLDEKLQGVKQKDRIAAINQTFANSVSDKKFDFIKKEAEYKNELHKEMIKANNVLKLNGLEMKTLESVNSTQTYVGRTIKMLDDPAFREVSGPLMAYNADTKQLEFVGEAALPKSWTPAKRAQVAAQLAHEIPRIGELAFPGGISRIASTPMGKELIQSMGANINQRPDQMQAVLKVVLDANTDRAASIVRGHKAAFATGEYDALIGADNPLLSDYWEKNVDVFGHPMDAPSARPTGGGKSESKPKGKYFDAAKGEWVTGG